MLSYEPIREIMAKNRSLFNAPRAAGKHLGCLVLSLLFFHPVSLQAAETPPALVYVSTSLVGGYEYSSISADGAGNSYAAFLVEGVLNVSKFSSDGALLWRTEQPGDLSYDARIKADAGGNSYVAATDYSSNNGYLYKFDTNGAFVKKQTVPAGITSYWESDDIAYDPLSGRIYTTVSFYNEDTNNGCVMVLAYDSNLELVASQTINDGPLDNWFARLAVDAQGNVYVNGITSGDDVAGNWLNGFFEAKYAPGLSSLIFKTAPILFDETGKWLRATAVDPQGNTYSAGEIEQGHNDYPAFLMKRSPAGDLMFLNTFQNADPSGWGWNTFYDVAVDKQGNPHVVNLDYAVSVIKYAPDGNILWSIKPFTPPFQMETSGIDIDNQGNIYTAGAWFDTDYNYSNVVMKYSAAAAPDTTAPAAITDLVATAVSSNSITLAWTAPGDDGESGTAAVYDLRHTIAGAILTDADFTAAAQVPVVSAPQAAGTPETFTLTGLLPATTYFFGIKTADEAGNVSGLSNSPQGVTAAIPVEKYSLSKYAPPEPHIVTVNAWSESLVSLVSIFGTTNPASGVKVDFSISTWPAGAQGQELSKSTEVVVNGLADVRIKLGNIPAEYGVTATCNSCEPSASSATFACCGKLPNDDFKQFDLRWATHPYNTQSALYTKNIGQKGCALTSLATVVNYYGIAFAELGISTTNPQRLNDTLVHNLKRKGYGFDDQHRLKFEMVSSTMVSGGKIVFNDRSDYALPLAPSDVENMRFTIDGDLNQRLPVIIAVNRSISVLNQITGIQEIKKWVHFVAVIGKCFDKYIISDPGSRMRKLINLEESTVLDESTQNTFGPVVGLRRFKKK